jgi:DNA-binding response OmpR family regulator
MSENEPHLLVVDDDARLRDLLRRYLSDSGFRVTGAADAAQARTQLASFAFDLIVLDVMMPGENGLDLTRSLRATSEVPVLLLTAMAEPEDRINGLETGADDYLAKPFSGGLLAAKVRAVLRRYAAPKELQETLKAEGLALDVEARTASFKGRRIHLTRKEFDLLTTFLRKPGRVLSVTYLLETVWGYDPADYNDPHTVGVHISSLRKKLGTRLGDRIVSVSGVGYRFEA